MIVFKNPGLIDLDAAFTMGVNAKLTDNAFGFFGTGLNYSVGVLLRTCHEVIIYRGTERFTLTTKTLESRGKTFQRIYLNDAPLGFTTELGKKWELWQAYRELYCNCMDENGSVFKADSFEPQADETAVIVIGSLFEDLFSESAEFILATQPIKKLKGLEIHPGASRTIFYRGIAVGRFAENKAPLHTYNITDFLSLTEDRTAKYNWEVEQFIAKALHTADDEKLIEETVHSPKGSLERTIDHCFLGTTPSPVFLAVVERLQRTHADDMNESAVVHANAYRPLPPIQSFELGAMEQTQFATAVCFLVDLGYNVQDHPIKFVESLGTGIYGTASCGEITLTRHAFITGTRQLAITLLEEHLHLTTGLSDMTRAFQDRILHELVMLGERRVLGHAL